MSMTKTEKRKLRSLQGRAKKLAKDAAKLAIETNRELEKQMRKS